MPPGYIKPPKQKTDDDTPPKTRTYDDWSKDVSLTEKIQSGAQLLWVTLNCSGSDWNPCGPRQSSCPIPSPTCGSCFKTNFERLALGSPEFGDLMRQLVPEFVVYSVRLCDGGHPEARAKLKLNLGSSIADSHRLPGLESLLSRDLTLDLFDPPQRERIRNEAVRLAAKT